MKEVGKFFNTWFKRDGKHGGQPLQIFNISDNTGYTRKDIRELINRNPHLFVPIGSTLIQLTSYQQRNLITPDVKPAATFDNVVKQYLSEWLNSPKLLSTKEIASRLQITPSEAYEILKNNPNLNKFGLKALFFKPHPTIQPEKPPQTRLPTDTLNLVDGSKAPAKKIDKHPSDDEQHNIAFRELLGLEEDKKEQ